MMVLLGLALFVYGWIGVVFTAATIDYGTAKGHTLLRVMPLSIVMLVAWPLSLAIAAGLMLAQVMRERDEEGE